MEKYQPLTKVITDAKGNEIVTCQLLGTEKCQQIHKPNGCNSCPMLAAILNQLHVFETIYLTDEQQHGEKDG